MINMRKQLGRGLVTVFVSTSICMLTSRDSMCKKVKLVLELNIKCKLISITET